MSNRTKWELFSDSSYYDMFAVRPVGDKDFDSPRLFHFGNMDDAKRFKELVEKAFISVPSEPKPEPDLDKRLLDDAKADGFIIEWFAKWCKETKKSGGVLITTSIKELLKDFLRYIIKQKAQ